MTRSGINIGSMCVSHCHLLISRSVEHNKQKRPWGLCFILYYFPCPDWAPVHIWKPDPSDDESDRITFGILGYVRISLGYLWDIRFSKDVPGMSLTYPIFVNFKLRYPLLIFASVASETNYIGLGWLKMYQGYPLMPYWYHSPHS